MIKALRKYVAASEAAERHLDDFKHDFRPLAERYNTIMALEKSRFQYENRMPEYIEDVTVGKEKLTISGTSYFRGCCERDSFSIPIRFIEASPEERNIMLLMLEDDIKKRLKAEDDKERREEEAKERETYERLRSKFGDAA